MLVEMTYTNYAANFFYGKKILKEFTPETLKNIDEYFEESGAPVTQRGPFNPDDFYVNIVLQWSAEDLEDYGFTPEQVKAAYKRTTHNPTPFHSRITSTHEALQKVNLEAYEALIEDYRVFGWDNHGSLVLM